MKSITLDDLATHTFVQLKEEKQSGEVLNPKIKDGFRNILKIDSYAAIKEAIKYDLGIGVLPMSLIQEDIMAKAITVLPYDKFNYKKPLYLISEKKKPQSEIVTLFINFISNEAQAFL